MKKLSTHAQAAKEVRVELKEKFPTTKFRVLADSFAGGDAVRISWLDGPTSKEVSEIVGKYQYGNFNGMTDMYEYSNKLDNITQVKFVQTSRSLSAEVMVELIKQLNTEYGISIEYKVRYSEYEGRNEVVLTNQYLEGVQCWADRFVYRESVNVNFEVKIEAS